MDNSGLQSYVTFDPRAFNISNLTGGAANDSYRTGIVGGNLNDPSQTVTHVNDPWANQSQSSGITPESNSRTMPGWNTPAPATDPTSSGTNSATPGALGALTNQPNLQHRQPSLAAGWGGWDQGSTNGPAGTKMNNGDMSTGAGNANFTYFSRFS